MKIRIGRPGGVLIAGALAVSTLFATGIVTAEATQYVMSPKQVVFGGQVVSQPMGFAALDPSSKTYTTYMPIYYVMQALQAAGIHSGWDGTNWTLTMPGNFTPSIDLNSVHPGAGPKKIFINNTDVQNVYGIVYPDPASHANTTYVPIWYVMKALGYANIQSGWDGKHWTMSSTSQTTHQPTTSGGGSDDTPPSGVQSGVVSAGDTTEQWQNNGQDVSLDNLKYESGGNQLPIQGKVDSTSRADIVVEVYHSGSSNWFYSIPVDNAGHFSATITLPYNGRDSVSVGIPQMSDSFGLGDSSAYENVENDQPTLSDPRLSLLQSWMVNYNESTELQSLARQITAGQNTPDGRIKAVSDWVSSNTEYNFPEVRANQVAWQQASQTLQTKIGVCQDQAALAASLLRSLNVPTRVVGGEAYDPNHSDEDIGPHAWNMAWDGTRWVTFDSTWDQVYTQDQSISPPDSVNHTYFDPPQQFFNQSHRPDASQPYGWSANQ